MSNPQAFLQELLKMGSTPQQIAQTLVQRNPQMQVVLNQIQQSGMTPEQFVMQIARQRGVPIDPQSLQQTMNQLRGMVPR